MFSTWKSDTSFDLSPRASTTSSTSAPPSSLAASLANAQASARASAAGTEATGVPKDACSVINEWLTMRGELESEGDILVKGRIHGNIRCRLLIIDTGAFVEGSITADDVVVRGTARGTIRTKRIRLEKTALVDSEIYHDSFAAEEGARIKGSLHTNEETAKADKKVEPETPESKVSSALYHMLDVARTPQHLRLASAQ